MRVRPRGRRELLDLLLLQPVLEEHEDGPLLAVDVPVLDEADHGGGVHRLPWGNTGQAGGQHWTLDNTGH